MKADVRTKIFIVSVFSLLALVFHTPEPLTVLLLLNVLTLLLFQVPLKILPFVKKAVFFYLFLIIMQSFFVKEGRILLGLNNYPLLTTGGILYGITIFLRFLVLFCSALIIAGCRLSELLRGLTKLGLPYVIVFMVQIGIRFVPLLAVEMQEVFNSMQLRGMEVRKIYKKEIVKTYCQIFSPVVFSIWKKARDFSILLELKGFRRYSERTYYYEVRLERRDYVIMAAYLFAAFLLLTSAQRIEELFSLFSL